MVLLPSKEYRDKSNSKLEKLIKKSKKKNCAEKEKDCDKNNC